MRMYSFFDPFRVEPTVGRLYVSRHPKAGEQRSALPQRQPTNGRLYPGGIFQRADSVDTSRGVSRYRAGYWRLSASTFGKSLMRMYIDSGCRVR